MMKSSLVATLPTFITGLALFILVTLQAGAAETGTVDQWPQEIEVSQGVVVIYQPEPEKLDGNRLTGRAAVAVEETGKDPVFGAIWFEARLDTDREERMATILDLSITRVRFPEDEQGKSEPLKKLLETEAFKWALPISMDRLAATLELADARIEAAEKISVEPPVIMVVEKPSVLVSLDGEPHITKENGTGLMRVVNTPFTMLFDPDAKTYYLYADVDAWYTASDWRGEWKLTDKVPREVAAVAPPADPEDQVDDEGEAGPTPRIIVATEPTELIVIDGKSKFTPITDTDVLYLSNSESDLLMDIASNEYYLLLAGRWYSSKTLQGPWRYVPGEKLPKVFATIPEDSEMGTVLYAVPGTRVAQEAVLDAQIPQTASVERSKATLEIEYDGKPEFEKIEGTSLLYAKNTATPVIRVQKKYYACDEAVWFVADSAQGAWKVATKVPDEIYTIPPDSPVYNVTYVRIYGSTPQVVYVGYLPGYTGTYVYKTTIVYGTGYYWPGWYGRYYYPRPATWGFHVRWNPWGGWSFGLSYSAGPFTFTIGRGGWYRGGWWGPGRYRGYRRGYRHGHRAGYRAGYRAGQRNSARNNVYRSQRNQARTKATAGDMSKRGKGAAAGKRANNVFADRDGNVHRKTDQGWEQRSKDGWKSPEGKTGKPTQKPEQKPTQQPSQKPSDKVRGDQSRSVSSQRKQSGVSGNQSQLERSSSARQRGSQRTQSFNKAQGGGGRSRGGGGRGGGRR